MQTNLTFNKYFFQIHISDNETLANCMICFPKFDAK